jgi:hypothetical protein
MLVNGLILSINNYIIIWKECSHFNHFERKHNIFQNLIGVNKTSLLHLVDQSAPWQTIRPFVNTLKKKKQTNKQTKTTITKKQNKQRRYQIWGTRHVSRITCMLCRSLFVLLYFFFWPLCCLSFLDIRIMITPLVSSNSS